MKLYKIFLLLLVFSATAHTQTLKEIIYATLENNYNIQASLTQDRAKKSSLESVDNTYLPQVTLGVNYSRLDLDTREVQVKNTTNGFLKLDVNLYDGGRNQAIKNQKMYEYKSSVFRTTATKKETILQVITLFYQTQTILENIKVFQEKSDTLKAQYERIQIKYDINMATIDEVLKLKSEYETNQFAVEELKFQKIELMQNLNLLSNLKITSLSDSTLPKIENIEFIESENVKSLTMGIKAQDEAINIVSAITTPQFNIENTLSAYDYNDYNERLLSDLPDQQNQLMLSLTCNLYDTVSADKIEATRLEKVSSQQRVTFVKEQEKINFYVAKKKLRTQQLKIDSLKSAVKMGITVFEMIDIKYQNGLVDNITYLDALSKKTYNQALYAKALNDYEIAKANYYLSSGMNYEDALATW
ncbi:MAG: TolC family protein [Campylobacterota bacterium]|nr:TolC family protein [Campylobacterota bacterium]